VASPYTNAESPQKDWAKSIRVLRQRLHLNQAELGRRLHYSPMAVSRWERGELEPTNRAYIELGNLADDPDCWFFWERGGLYNESLIRVMPVLRQRLQRSRFADFEIVTAGSGSYKNKDPKLQLVAIPLLKVLRPRLEKRAAIRPVCFRVRWRA